MGRRTGCGAPTGSTPLGEEQLAIEAARLQSNARTALARLNPIGGVAT